MLRRAGLLVNGRSPSDIQVHNPRLYRRLLLGGSMALGESYVEGWWDCEDLSEFFFRLLRARADEAAAPFASALQTLRDKLQSLRFADPFKVGHVHYDIDPSLYSAMLDKDMIYTCGYWKTAQALDEAQRDKMKLVCEKLAFKPGMRVLDIGCGWGGFLKYSAENYGVCGVGLTVSNEQAALARERCRGLDVDIRLQDYREARGSFDRIVSLGMFEHVGQQNYRTFFRTAAQCLSEKGLFLLHCIGGNKSAIAADPWIARYIFPNSMIPSIAQIGAAIEGLFVMEDWHNFGAHYDRTLMAWFANFARSWPHLSAKFDPTFYRKWKYYLLSCAGSFRARRNQLWQIVLSKPGVPGGYVGVR